VSIAADPIETPPITRAGGAITRSWISRCCASETGVARATCWCGTLHQTKLIREVLPKLIREVLRRATEDNGNPEGKLQKLIDDIDRCKDEFAEQYRRG
jgi:hypothetical protein